MTVQVRVPATSANLGAGYDCLGLALQRHVTVTATFRSSGDAGPPGPDLRVVTIGHGARRLPTGEDNLVWTSLVAFCREFDVAVPDVGLEVHNEIPLARGLGSSSSAIVAGLVLGRHLSGRRVATPDLVRLATRMEGHPDNVAPALLGGFVAGAVRADGEAVVRRGQPTSSLTVVVALPGTEQQTRHARAMVPEVLERDGVIAQASRAAHVTGGIVGAWPLDPGLGGDLLHEPARLPHMAVTADLLEAWRAADVFCWLSGAGPAAAALVADDVGTIRRVVEIARGVLADHPVDESAEPAGHEVVHLPFDLAGATTTSPA